MHQEGEAAGELNGSEVAIIGMAGRFPGAPTLERFWENLKNGVESIRVFTDEELLAAGTPAAHLSNPAYVKAKPVLDGVELFDAALFGIPPHEAQLIDPQQRLFLECAWEALERAGYNGDSRGGLVGVYAGVEMNTYLFNNVSTQPEALERAGDLLLEVSSDKDYLATRTSYKLDLRGPSVTVQTACSTSLVAIHLACQALLSGECDLALAGAAAVKVPQTAGYFSLEGGIKSPDGHCRAFDAAAQGTVFGSGAGVVVLKRLIDALEDGDAVHAVIKGSAINNDGADKIGYSAPGLDGQYQVIRAAQVVAEVDPETITYVEAHGTGTPLGDPIEVTALTRAFRAGTERKGFCALGSVKTNVGHLNSAAGVTGLIKTVLAMKHRQIPPSLHFERPNPQIDFANSPFYVNARLADWRGQDGAPLRAGISSFGVGGTNAHAVLEEAPPPEPSGPSRPWQLLVLSANTATALDALRADLAGHLGRHPGLPLADAAFTLQVGRRTGRHRGFVVARDAAGAAGALAAGRLRTAFQELRHRAVDFLFPGQGAQYPGMGRELYDTEPAFREQVDRCCEILHSLLGLDLRTVLYPAPDGMDEAARRLEQTALAQPALFVIEHALARLWMSLGVRPRAMLGHSLGEYVAACLAGVFSLEDALALVAERGRLMQALPAGAMLAVPLPEAEVAPLLGAGLSLAAVNGPARLVVSGSEPEVAALEAELARRGTPGKRLHTSHAFHSGMMDPVLAPFAERVRAVRRDVPELPFVSNLTGTWITTDEATDPGYWARHLRSAVRFHDGLRTLTADGDAALLEVGPGQTLSSFARQALPPDRALVRSLPHPKERETAGEFLLGAVGQLWLAGVEIDWKGLHAGERRHRVELPTYPFERQRYWLDRRTAPAAAEPAEARKDLADWFYTPAWVPAAAPAEPANGGAHRWLLLGGGEVAEAMARRLEECGDAVALVSPGEGYAELLARLQAAWGAPPDRVVDLSGGGFLPLLGLARELGRLPAGSGVELRVVTAGLQAVGRGERVTAPEAAVLLGPVRTLPLEHPGIGCAAVDVEPGEDPERLAELLIAETAAPAADPVVALRGEERWVERFLPVPLGPAEARRLPWRERGVWLITGGLGGLGLALAEELARSVRARLVLTGRQGLSDDPAHPRVQAVRRLEALGAEVLVLAADVTDHDAMREVVRRARERFGPLQGAIHAAGVPGGGVIQLKTAEAAERVLAPKIQGARALAAALADEPLDLLVFCSSTYAVTGGVGQVDYCAANAFLDAFARHLSARGLRAVSIGWGGWQEVGMAAEAARGGLTGPILPDAPLLTGREEGPDGVSYTGELSPSRHWLLAEHRIAGTPTLPGTAYLELAREVWSRETGDREAEISGVTFTSPLLVPQGSREIRVVLSEGAAARAFRAESRAADGPWQEHARGHVGPLETHPARHDVAAIAARCSSTVPAGNWDPSAPGLVAWGPRWRCLRAAHVGKDEALVEIELPPDFAADLDGLGLHPALLDVATAFGGGMLSGGQMLPASYGKVRCAASLPGSFLAYLHNPRRAEGDAELTLDVTLMNPEGEVLVEIEDFTMRRVARRREAAASSARPAVGDSADWIRPAEGVEAFRRIVSRGRFPHVVVSPFDLGRTIVSLRRRAAERPAEEPAAFPRPSLATEYVVPATEAEATLAGIWQTVLGIERVGTRDNFFDLGGDSIIGIQIVARASAAGLQLAADQLFEHQTVAELARLLSEPAATPEAPALIPGAEAAPLAGFDADLSSDELDKIFSQLD